MQIIGCDLHARQQTLAILDLNSGVLEERFLEHEGDNVREFYRALEGPVRVGIEATGSTTIGFRIISVRVGHALVIGEWIEGRKRG